MEKIYSLLRNNLQSGPFTLADLLAQHLKPLDLIWTEGGIGWSYPAEIPELKPFLHQQVQTNNKGSQEKSEDEVTNSRPSGVTDDKFPALQIEESTASILKNSHIFVSLPPGTTQKIPEVQPPDNREEIETSEARLERKALALKNKIQALDHQRKTQKEDVELDIKYARSLDDIKNEYTQWMKKEKKKKPPMSRLLIAGAVGMVTIFFILFFRNPKPNPGMDRIELPLAKHQKSSPYPYDSGFQREVLETAREFKTQGSESITGRNETPQSTGNLNSQPVSTPTQSTIDKVPGRLVEEDIDSIKRYTGTNVSLATPRDPDSSTENISDKNAVHSISKQISLSESVDSNITYLTVYNNSKQFINFVALDVMVEEKAGKPVQRKTMYFNNIAAGSYVKRPLRVQPNNLSRTYVMGLISTESGLFYAKQ